MGAIKRSLKKYLIMECLQKNLWNLARKRGDYLLEKNSRHQYINEFNPDITVLDTDYREDLTDFDAGIGNENFNVFLKKDVDEYRNEGNGVTYIIWNITYDEIIGETKDIVAYFTLAANAIPYIDRIKYEKETSESGEYDEENWGVPVLEIRMFAVNDKYQDVLAAWCLLAIVNYANYMLNFVLGFKALFLHSVPDAELFYLKNGFQDMRINMQPFANVDSDMRPMWLPLKDIHMNYETE